MKTGQLADPCRVRQGPMERDAVIGTRTLKSSDSYLDLVRRFPLRAIRTKDQHDAAIRVMVRLSGQDDRLEEGELEYLNALAVLVSEYERERYAIKARAVAPLALVKFLMQENAMTARDLGRVLGSQSAASMVLSGRRGISKEAARKLAARFGLEIGAFLA